MNIPTCHVCITDKNIEYHILRPFLDFVRHYFCSKTKTKLCVLLSISLLCSYFSGIGSLRKTPKGGL